MEFIQSNSTEGKNHFAIPLLKFKRNILRAQKVIAFYWIEVFILIKIYEVKKYECGLRMDQIDINCKYLSEQMFNWIFTMLITISQNELIHSLRLGGPEKGKHWQHFKAIFTAIKTWISPSWCFLMSLKFRLEWMKSGWN